ncbi:MAG: glycosyltransferase family 9 protein [Bacteroidales bacterium]|nr:glycosyltransferase family 9 protein [Bacteroidales bacterium]
MPRNKSILVIRLSAIGDVAMSVHAVRALRDKYPDHKITVCTRERLAGFFAGVPDLDFIFFPAKATFVDLLKFILKARKMNFGYVADIQNNLRTSIMRIGLHKCFTKVAAYDQRTYAKWRVKRRFCKRLTPVRNNVLRFCDVFAELGLPVDEPKVVKKVLPLPEAFDDIKNGNWIGIAPFSRKEKKIYPLDMMTKVVDMLTQKAEKVFIFSGPGKEKAYADELAARYPNVVPVFGKTDFNGETALISNLDVLITMDSATMHMATLTGAPFICVWGGTHPSTGYSAWGADWKANYIQADMPCRPCSNYGEGKCRYKDFRCFKEIDPVIIVYKTLKFLNND